MLFRCATRPCNLGHEIKKKKQENIQQAKLGGEGVEPSSLRTIENGILYSASRSLDGRSSVELIAHVFSSTLIRIMYSVSDLFISLMV